MSGGTLTGALALCVAGPLLLRYGWQRSKGLVAIAWAAMAMAAIVLAVGEGAWGLTAGASAAMVTALAILAQASIATAAPHKVMRERAAAPLPPGAVDWADVARRFGVFVIVVLADLAASLFLAWTAQRALFRSGGSEADASALALFLLPLLWLAVASWQMTCRKLTAMAAAPLCLVLLGGITWLAR